MGLFMKKLINLTITKSVDVVILANVIGIENIAIITAFISALI